MRSAAYHPLPEALGKETSRLKLYPAFWQVKPEGSLQLPSDPNVHQNIHANQHAKNCSNLEETKERG